MAGKNRWSVVFVLLFLALAINIGIKGGLALALSLPGAFLIILGQKTIFGDRIRGDYFMEHNGATNPNPIGYSYGELYLYKSCILSTEFNSPPNLIRDKVIYSTRAGSMLTSTGPAWDLRVHLYETRR